MQVTKLHGGVRARTVAHRSTPVYVKHGDSSSLNGERHSGEVCDGVRVLLGRSSSCEAAGIDWNDRATAAAWSAPTCSKTR